MNQVVVPYYGIHRTSTGVAYLQQGRSGTNALGLREKSPFVVRLPTGRVHCNHQIPLSAPVPHDHHWEIFLKLVDDPLVEAMLPLPKEPGEGVYFLPAEDDRHTLALVMLSTMSSPIYPCVVPAWMMRREKLVAELYSTNVQPLVVTHLTAKHSDLVNELTMVAATAPRKLLLVGKPDVIVPKSVKRLETDLFSHEMEDLQGLPWEILGATLIRKYMRGEWNGSHTEGGSGR